MRADLWPKRTACKSKGNEKELNRADLSSETILKNSQIDRMKRLKGMYLGMLALSSDLN